MTMHTPLTRLIVLRLEAAAALAIAAGLYGTHGGSWKLFALLLLAPDLGAWPARLPVPPATTRHTPTWSPPLGCYPGGGRDLVGEQLVEGPGAIGQVGAHRRGASPTRCGGSPQRVSHRLPEPRAHRPRSAARPAPTGRPLCARLARTPPPPPARDSRGRAAPPPSPTPPRAQPEGGRAPRGSEGLAAGGAAVAPLRAAMGADVAAAPARVVVPLVGTASGLRVRAPASPRGVR